MLDLTEPVKAYRQRHVSPDSMPQGYVYRNLAGVYVFDTPEEADVNLVGGMERTLRTAQPGEGIILSTDASYESVYAIMAERHAVFARLLKDLLLINQDELLGINVDDPRAYTRYMRERLFAVFPELDEGNWVIPRPDPQIEPSAALGLYILQLKVVQTVRLALLGIGPDEDLAKGLPSSPHVGFIKPNTPLDVLADIVDLDATTRHVNSGGHPGSYPAQAISHGPADLVRARNIFLLAKGKKKQRNIARTVLGELDLKIPATVIHAAKKEEQAQENNLTFFLDREAAKIILEMFAEG